MRETGGVRSLQLDSSGQGQRGVKYQVEPSLVVETQGFELGGAGPKGVTQRRVNSMGGASPEALGCEGLRSGVQCALMSSAGRSRVRDASPMGRPVAARLDSIKGGGSQPQRWWPC